MGVSKIAPTFEKALWRARNIARAKNAQRLGPKKTPARQGRPLLRRRAPTASAAPSVLWARPAAIEYTEVVIVEQELGLSEATHEGMLVSVFVRRPICFYF